MQTPVDLQSYTTPGAAARAGSSRPPIAEPAARLTIARRPAVEMPAPQVRVGAAAAAATAKKVESAPAAEDDRNLELDVPAFLRRSEG